MAPKNLNFEPSVVTASITADGWIEAAFSMTSGSSRLLDLLDGEVGSQSHRTSSGSPPKAGGSGGTAATSGCYSPEGKVSGGSPFSRARV
jgi:hypothetical protein